MHGMMRGAQQSPRGCHNVSDHTSSSSSSSMSSQCCSSAFPAVGVRVVVLFQCSGATPRADVCRFLHDLYEPDHPGAPIVVPNIVTRTVKGVALSALRVISTPSTQKRSARQQWARHRARWGTVGHRCLSLARLEKRPSVAAMRSRIAQASKAKTAVRAREGELSMAGCCSSSLRTRALGWVLPEHVLHRRRRGART